MPDISPHALVEKGAKIAENVQIGAFSYIGAGVEIGAGSVIGNNVTITGRTILGERNTVFPMAVIGAQSEDSAPDGKVIIGPANSIREHVTIYAGSDRPTELGTGNLLMIGCQIGAGAKLSNHGIFANITHVLGNTEIEDYVGTSGFTVVEKGVKVGAYAYLAGFSGINRDAPPYAIVQGYPFRVRGVNSEKLKRCGFGDDDIRALKTAFRELFDGVTNAVDGQALARILKDPAANPHVRRVAEALQRGLAQERQE